MSNQIRDGVVGDLDKAGVYFSANDAVLEWVYPFLESFREFNPELPLILIPFNDAYSRLAKLGSKYRFDIFSEPSLLELDEIGRIVVSNEAPLRPHYFRRYAAFWGPLEQFIYLDTDILVLGDLRLVLDRLNRSAQDFFHFGGNIQDAYLPGDYWNEMIRDRRHVEFNSGAWASRRGTLSLIELREFACRVQGVREHLNLEACWDQSFINFICHTRPVNYAHVRTLDPSLSAGYTNWIRDVRQIRGKYVRWQPGIEDHGRHTLFLHFAGTHRPFPLMKFRQLYLRYRVRSEPWLKRLFMRVVWAKTLWGHRINKYLVNPLFG